MARAGEVSFDHEVMAVLSKAGCNMGACHGNFNGKGGFRLSLRGENPTFDFESLTRESNGRRIDHLNPDASLILLKPTGRVSHQGGVRFHKDSREYQVLHDWVAAGTPRGEHKSNPVELRVTPPEAVLIEPATSVSLQVRVRFADGSERDVTRLTTFELSNLTATVDAEGQVNRLALGETTIIARYLQLQVPIRLAFVPARPEFVWSEPPTNNFIDVLTFARLRELRMNPSEHSDDATFIRRAFLDAIGRLPTADEARQFLADQNSDKRSRLIDRLLARPEFADHWALKWSDLLRNEEKVLDPKGVELFHGWIRDSMAQGKPLDQFVRELLRAEGSTYEIPAANYWRANRDPTVRAETTARLFLGLRLQCAKCHNHPFDRWTQDDYYAWAALFSKVDYQVVENNRKDKLDKNEFVGEQVIFINENARITDPRSGEAPWPKLLGDRALGPASYQDRLTPLAYWLTSADNDLFAKSQANFIWYHLLGRGLVEPIDDFRPTNPATNPVLLEALAREFVAGQFDVRHLVRTILNSRVYQLASVPNGTNRDDENNFAHARIYRLPAEKLLDAQSDVLGLPAKFAGYDLGMRAMQIPGVQRVRSRDEPLTSGDRFLRTFGKPERLLACECERSNETTLAQAFALISGELHEQLESDDNRVARLVRQGHSDAEIVDELYWTALSRAPTPDESQAAATYLATHDREDADAAWLAAERLERLQDIAWALLNSKEFLFRR